MIEGVKPYSSYAPYGVEKRWESSARSVSKGGLRWALTLVVMFSGFTDHEMEDLMQKAKSLGRAENAARRMERIIADPVAWHKSSLRRSRAAKKAARTRKKKGGVR